MYTVLAKNAGIVKRTRDIREAEQVYRVCRDESAAGHGPYAYESIQLLEGDRVVRESVGTLPPVAYHAGY